MLALHQVEKSFRIDGRAVPILNIPEWKVEAGEQVAITGPSGSGKSTLLHLVSGLLRPDRGEIRVDGQALEGLKESELDRYRAGKIGYVLQDFHLIPSLTARQNIELALAARLSAAERKRLVEGWLERVGMRNRAEHLPSQLSRGQQQRIAIVRALINQPLLVLADEPTGSLDWESADTIAELLLELSGKQNHTLLVVTHDRNLARRFPKSVDIYDINRLKPPGYGEKLRLPRIAPEGGAV